jgi:5-methylthioadenosine/S-adenosylhomocysteine deaminase
MAEIKIIRNGNVVTCDAQRRAGPMCIMVRGDRIAELLPDADSALARYPDAEVIDAADKVIFPGFVDAFYEGDSFILRHLIPPEYTSHWHRNPQLKRALAYLRKEAEKDQLVLAYRAAYFSALKSGITYVAEAGFDNLDLPLEAARASLRRSDLKGMIALRNGDQIENAKRNLSGPIRYACALPAEEDLTVYNLQSSLRVAQEQQWPILVRLGETRKGHETLKRTFQRSAVQIMREYGLLNHKIQVVHLNFFEGEDIDALAHAALPVVVSPQAAIIGVTPVPPLAQLLSANIPLALGTSWGLPDPFANMRALQLLMRGVGATPLDPFDLLATHTILGARALGVEQETGSIETGKKADLVIVDVGDIRVQHLSRALPLRGSLSTLLQELTPYHVCDVMINGEFFVRRGEIMTYAEEDLRRETNDLIQRVTARVGEIVGHAAPDSARRRSAPILPLVPKPRHDEEIEPAEQPAEVPEESEGFNATEEREDESSTRAKPDDQPPKSVELPKTVKRVFGEDDLV